MAAALESSTAEGIAASVTWWRGCAAMPMAADLGKDADASEIETSKVTWQLHIRLQRRRHEAAGHSASASGSYALLWLPCRARVGCAMVEHRHQSCGA